LQFVPEKSQIAIGEGMEVTMRRLKESERSRLREYLLAEPEINLFFIGLIENNSINSDDVMVFAEESGTDQDMKWDIVILRYYDNYVLYSYDDIFPVKKVVDFLKMDIVDSLNGKASVLRKIAPFFPHMKMEEKVTLRLDGLNETAIDKGKVKLRLLTPQDAGKIVELYSLSKDCALNYGKEKNDYIAERRGRLAGEGIAIGLIYKHRLVSVAEIAADNDITGLIVGIATHPKYYGRGFATQAITALCEEAFRRGKKHICFLHENSNTTSLLKNIGFEEKNQFALLH